MQQGICPLLHMRNPALAKDEPVSTTVKPDTCVSPAGVIQILRYRCFDIVIRIIAATNTAIIPITAP